MVLCPTLARSQDSVASVLRVVRPAFELSWTSGAPDARRDGAAISGVGLDLLLSAGGQGSIGRFSYSVVPRLVVSANRDHQTFVSGDPARSRFASPFYFGDFSADLPSRPGDGTLVRAALGESGIWWTGRRTLVGLMSSSPEWGPNVGSARADDVDRTLGEGLVLGRSAPGLPRVEVAYAWRHTRSGNVMRVRGLSGLAHESDWFDDVPRNDSRIVSGARFEYERSRWLKVGAARTVMSKSGRGTFDAIAQPFARSRNGTVLELLSADVLLDFEQSGSKSWLEIARQAPIRSARDFFRFPTEGIALRLGLMQRIRRSETAEWSLSIEATRLDQSGTRADVVPNDFYTSPGIIQGWTHRGQPLGAGLGPGGQHQAVRVNRAGRAWRLSAFAERVRRNEDAMFRAPSPSSDRHDVALEAGVIATRSVGGYDISARLSGGRRFNYLFQGPSETVGGAPVDLAVLRAGLSFTPTGIRSIVRPSPKS